MRLHRSVLGGSAVVLAGPAHARRVSPATRPCPGVVSVCHSLQAASDLEGNVRHVAALMEHPAFDITKPPACEHLLLGFADSVPNFHAEDGSGYAFMADAVLKVGCC